MGTLLTYNWTINWGLTTFWGWKTTKNTVILELGRNSLYIYILQIFFFYVYPRFKILPQMHYSAWTYFALPFLSFILSNVFLFTGKGLKKVPLLGLVFFGKQ